MAGTEERRFTVAGNKGALVASCVLGGPAAAVQEPAEARRCHRLGAWCRTAQGFRVCKERSLEVGGSGADHLRVHRREERLYLGHRFITQRQARVQVAAEVALYPCVLLMALPVLLERFWEGRSSFGGRVERRDADGGRRRVCGSAPDGEAKVSIE